MLLTGNKYNDAKKRHLEACDGSVTYACEYRAFSEVFCFGGGLEGL
jgi:hypothetical protein